MDNVDDAEMSIFVIACAMVASSSSSVQVTMPPPVLNHLLPLPPLMTFRGGAAKRAREDAAGNHDPSLSPLMPRKYIDEA